MSTSAADDATALLLRLSDGDRLALDQLLPRVYAELRALANRALRRERPDHTLQTTALAHEAYLRLIEQSHVQWRHQAHFLAVAAQVMRRILVDHARARQAAKRNGRAQRVLLDESALQEHADPAATDVAALDEALCKLMTFDPAMARLVELRFFGGLTIEETAEVMGASPATLKRDWMVARAWLRKELQRDL